MFCPCMKNTFADKSPKSQISQTFRGMDADDLDMFLERRKAQFSRLERCVFYIYLVLVILLAFILFGFPLYLILV